LEIQNLPGGRQVRSWILFYLFYLHIFKKKRFIFSGLLAYIEYLAFLFVEMLYFFYFMFGF